MILGLDISTSTVGFCILDKQKNLVKLDFLSLSKEKQLLSKSESFRKKILQIKETFQIERVLIEENLQAFRPGLSSAKTIVTLARFNGICTYLSAKVFKIEPEFVNVNAARKMVGLKIDRKSGKDTKQQVLDFVEKDLGKYDWPTKILKGGPNRGNEVLTKECYDMADAYVIAASFFS